MSENKCSKRQVNRDQCKEVERKVVKPRLSCSFFRFLCLFSCVSCLPQGFSVTCQLLLHLLPVPSTPGVRLVSVTLRSVSLCFLLVRGLCSPQPFILCPSCLLAIPICVSFAATLAFYFFLFNKFFVLPSSSRLCLHLGSKYSKHDRLKA